VRLLVLSSLREISTDRSVCEGATPTAAAAAAAATAAPAAGGRAPRAFDACAVALSAVRFAACQAQAGRYLDARSSLISTQRLLQRAMCNDAAAAAAAEEEGGEEEVGDGRSSAAQQASDNQNAYLSFITQAEKLDQFMRELQIKEKVFGGGGGGVSGGGGSDRKKERDDQSSQAIYKMKALCATDFYRK